MALDLAMRNYNQQRGRYEFYKDPTTGDVGFDETQMHAVVTSVVERELGYFANRRHGTRLYELRNLTSSSPSEAEAEVLAGVQDLVDANLILDPIPDAFRDFSVPAGRLLVFMTWRTPGAAAPNEATV